MKNKKLSIIISHYKPKDISFKNPLLKTLDSIKKQAENYDIEIIIADDGSDYSSLIMSDYSKKINIKNDVRNIYLLSNEKLDSFLKKININNNLIKKWIYLPKHFKCMSKAKVLNYAVDFSNSDDLLFLDDDNYFISENTITHLIDLFKRYNFIIGQIKDNNGRLRQYSSTRVQGTTIAINKNIFFDINGFGEWTEKFSCGVDSDFWIKVFNYFQNHSNLKACYTSKLSTFDSCSKRWKKYTKIFQDFKLKKEFRKLYNIKNYKSSYSNYSRSKNKWIENLINNE